MPHQIADCCMEAEIMVECSFFFFISWDSNLFFSLLLFFKGCRMFYSRKTTCTLRYTFVNYNTQFKFISYVSYILNFASKLGLSFYGDSRVTRSKSLKSEVTRISVTYTKPFTWRCCCRYLFTHLRRKPSGLNCKR